MACPRFTSAAGEGGRRGRPSRSSAGGATREVLYRSFKSVLSLLYLVIFFFFFSSCLPQKLSTYPALEQEIIRLNSSCFFNKKLFVMV